MLCNNGTKTYSENTPISATLTCLLMKQHSISSIECITVISFNIWYDNSDLFVVERPFIWHHVST